MVLSQYAYYDHTSTLINIACQLDLSVIICINETLFSVDLFFKLLRENPINFKFYKYST